MDLFLNKLPKIELHAHLNGSLNISGIKILGRRLYGENSPEFTRLCEKFIDFKIADLDNCFQKFAFMHELTSTPKGLQLACEMVIKHFSLDNVIYLELRTTPKVNENMTRREYIDILVQAIKDYSALYNIKVKLLLSIDRAQTVESAEETVNLALEYYEKYPDILKGLDLSGNPKIGMFGNFLPVLTKAKQANLKLALHCAEVLNPEESNEMIEFGFQRCGHGTFLTTEQLKKCSDKHITIECCLTSNIKCGTVKSYDCHHFEKLFKSGIATVLCTDDCGVFNTTLTEEFKHACKYFHLSRDDIFRLCLNAIKASFADQNEKTCLTESIKAYFEKN